MLTVTDINFLKSKIPFYSQLTNDDQQQLIDGATLRFLKKGGNLTSQNEECSGLMLVQTGRIRIYIMSADGREVTMFRLLDGDICLLSASCLFRNVSFTFYFEVEKDTSVIHLAAGAIEDISKYNIHVKQFLLEQMSLRFSSALWVMEQVLFGSLANRVAAFFLQQANLENSKKLSLTHERIAKNIGSAREVVSRMVKQLEADSVIRTTRGTIYIENLEKLKALAEKQSIPLK